ncbi:MAG: response regulator [Candidatus Parabeggiatoa sp.]|nr:response regulator [Candidatus Parabeggiatoa sp.]
MKLKIRTKLLLAFAFILLFSSAVNIYGLFQMDVLADLTTKIYNHPLQVTRAVLTANTSIIKMHRSMKDVALAANAEDIKAAHLQVKQYEQEVYQQFAIVQKWILGDEGEALVAETHHIFQNWLPIREEVIALMQSGQRDKAAAMSKSKGAEHVALLDRKMEALKNYAANKAKGMYDSTQATRTRVFATTIMALITVMIISISVALFISLGIAKSVQIINAIANKIVVGEITSTVTNRTEIDKVIAYRDEMGDIGQAFYAIAKAFKTVIDDIVEVSQGLAKGNLRIMPKATYQGDFTQIKEALETALPDQRQVVEDIIQVSQGLAAGDLRVTPQVEYKGDFVQVKQALENALSDLREVIEDIVIVSQGLAEGEQRVMAQAEYRGDFVQIKNALETASVKMSEATTQNRIQDWLKTGQTQLSEQISGEQEIIQLAKNIITFLATYLDMPVGLFYRLEEPKKDQKPRLKLIASYAYTHRKGVSTDFQIGEGMVGQSALEQKPILMTKVPDNYYLRIQSGLGQGLPHHVLVQPFMYEETVKGVIELASFKSITEIQQEFLNQIMPSIGIAINSAESRTRMQVLLEKSRIQTEELQTQTEELQTQQEELRQTNEELEERTRELERQKENIRDKNQALEQTKADMETAKVAIEKKAHELELASKYKSEFLANMSHELRTPLNSLLILAQLLSENMNGNLTEQEVEYAQTIYSAGSDLLTLINEILDLSKVEAGKIEVNPEDMSLMELVEPIEYKFRPVADKKGLVFQITIAEDVPKILHTDAHRLQQIINNLLSNALKFTSEGEVKLTIESLKSPQAQKSLAPLFQMEGPLQKGHFMVFSVSDSGIGIPEDKQMVIFEAFQQVDGTTSRRFGGTGLGLSISRQLSRLLGGELQLHSEEGKGSTFTLYIPERLEKPSENQNNLGTSMAAVDIPSDHILSSNDAPKATESSEIKIAIADDRDSLQPEDKILLIIEDDRKFFTILMKLARERGFKCLVAADGKSGLQLAAVYHPHAIVLDVGLPEMDGWTVMEKLKDNPDTRHIPVHFMSASDQGKDAKQMGAIGYLLKPISMAELGEAFNSIEQFLSKTVKNLLVIVDDEQHQENILDIVGNEEVEITTVATLVRTKQELQLATFDSIILDVDVEQQTGIKILEQLQHEDNLSQIPVIVYSGRELTEEEEKRLQKCSNNLTIKSVRSPERLLDEATLFLHQVETRLPKEKQQMLQQVHNKEGILSHKKVLIVDDDVRNTFALTTFLESKDMEVIVGDNGKEALELLNEHPDIAIALMDIMMPEMDGYEAIQEIRKQAQFRKLPIIALTAKAMKGDKLKCIEAGASDYLSKPVDTDKLISLMRVWLYR